MRRRAASLRIAARKAVAILALVGYVAATVGCPVPNVETSDSSDAYPCAGRGCGCRSAEECWRGCCCFSLSERLAWAAAHGITPPSYAGQKLEQPTGETIAECNAAAHADRRAGSAGAPCCPHCRDASPAAQCCKTAEPCSAEHALVAAQCRDQGHAGCCAAHGTASKPHAGRRADSRRVGWLIGMQWLKCRGIGSHWMALGDPVAPPPPVVGWQRDERIVGTIVERSVSFSSPVDIPPTRPG